MGRRGIRTRAEKHRLERRNAQLVGALGFLAAAVMPVVLWHRSIGMVAEDFHFEWHYLVTGWTAYGLIAAGLLFFVPVVISIGRNPESRLYPRSRGALAGWGVSLYTLGFLLATQVATIAEATAGP